MLLPTVGLLGLAIFTAGSTGAAKKGCEFRPLRMQATGCRIINSDSSAKLNPAKLWGRVDCAASSRAKRLKALRGPGRSATGNGRYRQLTVMDGDNISGERCELGLNDWRGKTFAKFRQGEHRVTFASFRFPKDFPLHEPMWQTVLQMKQAEPSLYQGLGPILEVDADHGRLRLIHDWTQRWSTPIVKDRWIRIALDVRYSQSHRGGSVRMYVDRNGDGDARDKHERSKRFHVSTLKRELPGETIARLPVGTSIPSHLRIGIYHDPNYACPAPKGCPIQVDNVRVVALPRH